MVCVIELYQDHQIGGCLSCSYSKVTFQLVVHGLRKERLTHIITKTKL